ncbi:(Fe-S)-binding protein [Clostridium sp.]|uniref:(Fe-S)-binding protein n=1 Tax=Clostridium sp. TaxID=1506 RepID=UPI001A3EFBD9|nr:(Fe-S)-binding protein [Clostridium sp.]MBK5242636.1 (Fe-S)-binding protein [Clostridium sp.]
MKNIAFMPGCSLSSYSPKAVGNVLNYLKENFNNVTAIQKCCGMPTLVIGQSELFSSRYESLKEDIKYLDIYEIIVACQSCFMTLKEYSGSVKITSLWTLMPELGLPKEFRNKAKDSDIVFSIQDSCATRNNDDIHNGIRWILTELGYKYLESKNSRENSLCCGQGGMISTVNPDVSRRMAQKIVSEFNTDYVVTYCAACRSSMYKVGKESYHILDLIFGPVVFKSTKGPPDILAMPIKAWTNRYKSKKIIKKIIK